MTNALFVTPDEQKLYIERANIYIASQKAAAERCFAKDKEDWDAALREVERVSQPDDQELRGIARDLRRRNDPGFWSKFRNARGLEHLIGWLRHHGRCVYCGKDLIGEQYIRHGWATTDHLLPQSKYPNLDRCSLNTVPACSACNCLKRAMDPSQAPCM
jgi:hypothetical protein